MRHPELDRTKVLKLYKNETSAKKESEERSARVDDDIPNDVNLDACVKHWEMSGKLKRLLNLLADWN
jgi:hypothetical protein